jgi:hypothetical protein
MRDEVHRVRENFDDFRGSRDFIIKLGYLSPELKGRLLVEEWAVNGNAGEARPPPPHD